MSSYYNNIPIYETINVNYGNIETLDTTTLKTKNLYIDNVKTSNKIITQNLTLDTDNIESLSKASDPPYTADNNKITSKGYVDEQINIAVNLSECVKNNIDQTLTNKFIMNNTNNEFTTKNLTINTSKTITNTTALSSSSEADDAIISTKYYVDNNNVGKKYLVSDVVKGEIFNNYTSNKASGSNSHAEGYNTTASGDYSHAEGTNTTASGDYSHTEGGSTKASGLYSHAEGGYTQATKFYSHSEGYYTTASGNYSHSGGNNTIADQANQTAIGKYNTSSNSNSLLSVGNGTATNARSDALVVKSTGEVIINSTATDTTPTLTIGTSKGITATTASSSSTNTGDNIIATKYYVDNSISGFSGVGQNYLVSDVVKGEIFNNYINNIASGGKSHAEGNYTTASNIMAHAEGNYTTASGPDSHAEGFQTTASGPDSHSEGFQTTASGTDTHAEGYNTTASGSYSHAGGYYTTADQINQTAIGKYNTASNTDALLSVGNGTANISRSDALVVKSTGEVIINSTATDTTPTLTIGTSKGITGTTGGRLSTQADDAIISTKYYVDNIVSTTFSNCTIRIRYKTTSNTYNTIDVNTFGVFVFKSSSEIYFTGDLLINSNSMTNFNTSSPYICIEYIQRDYTDYICTSNSPYDQTCMLYFQRYPRLGYLLFDNNPTTNSQYIPKVYLIEYISHYDGYLHILGSEGGLQTTMIKLNYVNFVKKGTQ